MSEIAADPPSPSCYRLFSGSGIQEFQRFGPDLFCFARTRYAVGAVLPLSALTDKDRGDLEFGLAMGADWVALPFTTSGYTSLPAARERAAAPIPSLSADPVVARRMALVWGVHSVLIDNPADIEEIIAQARRPAREDDFAKPGDIIAITAGTPFGVSGNTNLLKLAVV